MSLDRQDLRIKLNADDHSMLALLAEEILVRVVRRRVHAAMVIAKKAQRLGIAGQAFPADE